MASFDGYEHLHVLSLSRYSVDLNCNDGRATSVSDLYKGDILYVSDIGMVRDRGVDTAYALEYTVVERKMKYNSLCVAGYGSKQEENPKLQGYRFFPLASPLNRGPAYVNVSFYYLSFAPSANVRTYQIALTADGPNV